MKTQESGARLRQRRLEAGLSAMRLGALAGVSQAAVYAIESGRVVSPTVDIRLKIAGALGIPASTIWPEMTA